MKAQTCLFSAQGFTTKYTIRTLTFRQSTYSERNQNTCALVYVRNKQNNYD